MDTHRCIWPECPRFCFWQDQAGLDNLSEFGWVKTPNGMVCPTHVKLADTIGYLYVPLWTN